MRTATIFGLVAAPASAATMQSGMNPIRRVVSMLQMMQKKVEKEGEQSKSLHNKFMCYCNTNIAEMDKKIEDGTDRVPQLESEIKELAGQKEQVESEIASHKSDKAAAEEAMAEATSMREKEAKEFADTSGEAKANIDAVSKAIPAIEQGMGESFLQTAGAETLKALLRGSSARIDDSDRDTLDAFLQGEAGYTPASGQIVGILKQMKEEMQADLADITKQENEAIASYNEMMSSKQKEIAAAEAAVEVKTGRVGELAVSLVETKDDLKDTENTLEQDKEFARTLKEKCANAEKDFEVESATRQEELAALADTIKVLNDDESTELFKKTETFSQLSLLQVDDSAADVKAQALDALISSRARQSPYLALVSFALRGKKVGFEKVSKLIHQMIGNLKREQKDDDEKKTYCEQELDKAEDEEKVSVRAIKTLEAKIEQAQDAIKTVKAELAELEAGVKELDQAVEEATEQRKEEHDQYTKESAESQAAVELIEVAKNRLNKFYNKELYKAPPKRELTEEERIYQNMGGELEEEEVGGIAGTGVEVEGFVQVTMTTGVKARAKKAGGVVAMLNMLQQDLKTEMASSKQEEEDAQKEYEKLMETSQAKRQADSEAMTEKAAAISDAEESLSNAENDKKSAGEELYATRKTIANLHGECDFLQQNFGLRKQARDDEINALDKANAVLNGADYSLIQTHSFMHRRA
mmetsp:Transcript_21290/g.51523  ORF Transcript_21290/g.51523 Transcript_21290/m.51523 type:complete len:699 (+) Transcript_21290:86-2182(+)